MQTALWNGQLVWAQTEAKKAQRTYWCPDCGQKVHLCQGTDHRPYFAHYAKSRCDANETAIHQLGKQQIGRWLNQQGWPSYSEVYLPTIKQRPDILTRINDQWAAIEFQCSPLGLTRLIERNQGYERLGIAYRWFLGPTYAHRLQPGKAAQFLQWHHQQLILPFWNLKRQQPDYQKRRLFGPKSGKSRQDVWQILIWQTQQLQRQIRLATPRLCELANQTYLMGHGAISTCLLVAHDTHFQWSLMNETPLEWRISVILRLEQCPAHQCWNWPAWYDFLNHTANWLPLPCLSDVQVTQVRHRILACYTQELNLAGVIRYHQQVVELIQPPRWFSSYERKLAYLEKLAAS